MQLNECGAWRFFTEFQYTTVPINILTELCESKKKSRDKKKLASFNYLQNIVLGNGFVLIDGNHPLLCDDSSVINWLLWHVKDFCENGCKKSLRPYTYNSGSCTLIWTVDDVDLQHTLHFRQCEGTLAMESSSHFIILQAILEAHRCRQCPLVWPYMKLPADYLPSITRH